MFLMIVRILTALQSLKQFGGWYDPHLCNEATVRAWWVNSQRVDWDNGLEIQTSMGNHPKTSEDEYSEEVSKNEVGSDWPETLSMTRRSVSNQSDRYMIELGEARVLFRTYEATGKKVLTPVRIEWLERTYGTGSVERIKSYMVKLQKGELEWRSKAKHRYPQDGQVCTARFLQYLTKCQTSFRQGKYANYLGLTKTKQITPFLQKFLSKTLSVFRLATHHTTDTGKNHEICSQSWCKPSANR